MSQTIPSVELAGQSVLALRVILPNDDVAVMPWALFLKGQLLSSEKGSVAVLVFASGTIRIEGSNSALESLLEGAASQWLRSIRIDERGITSIEIEDPD
jgi:hypothetical protein